MEKIELVGAMPEDFEDYFAIKDTDSDVFWIGFEGRPNRDKLYACFMERTADRDFGNPGDKRIYMIRADGRNVGMIQFTLSEEGLEFGIGVMEREQGKGYGSAGMKLAVKEAVRYSDRCFAHIRDDNFASQHALMSAGLERTDEAEIKMFPQSGPVMYRLYILREN